MPTKIIVDCSTGISTEVELTAEEIAQMEADAVKFAEEKSKKQKQRLPLRLLQKQNYLPN